MLWSSGSIEGEYHELFSGRLLRRCLVLMRLCVESVVGVYSRVGDWLLDGRLVSMCGRARELKGAGCWFDVDKSRAWSDLTGLRGSEIWSKGQVF